MAKEKMEEYEDEVFIYTYEGPTGANTGRSLVVIDKKNNNVFSLEAKNYFGKATEEMKKDMKSIGVFSVYD